MTATYVYNAIHRLSCVSHSMSSWLGAYNNAFGLEWYMFGLAGVVIDFLPIMIRGTPNSATPFFPFPNHQCQHIQYL